MKAKTYNPPLVRYKYNPKTRRVHRIKVLGLHKHVGETWVFDLVESGEKRVTFARYKNEIRLPGFKTKAEAIKEWTVFFKQTIEALDARFQITKTDYERERADRLDQLLSATQSLRRVKRT